MAIRLPGGSSRTRAWDEIGSLLGAALLPGGEIAQVLLRIDRDSITAVEHDPRPATVHAARRDRGTVSLRSDEVVAPAFVDVHCHGAGGGSAHDPASLRRMAGALRAHGVGAFLATTVTAPLADLLGLAHAARDMVGRPMDGQAVLLGFHLEGPALAPAHAAGHDPTSFASPASLARSLREDPVAWRDVRAVTLAPELPGGPGLVADLSRAGTVASIGHTGATFEEAVAAYATGARSTTHLFNGMPPLHHRVPGPVGAALAAAPFVELLCDGVHVDARLLPSVARAIGDDRLLLVSDAVPLAGGGPRRGSLAGARITARDGRAVDEAGTLAGSLRLLDGMVAGAVASGIPLALALRAASENPARLLGLEARGRIAPGAMADLVIVSRHGRLRHVLSPGPGR
jgi:N-acetylglucosamine-6-phosphate deacetylase